MNVKYQKEGIMKKIVLSLLCLLPLSAFSQVYNTNVEFGGIKQQRTVQNEQPLGFTSSYPVSISCSNGKEPLFSNEQKKPSLFTEQKVVQQNGYIDYHVKGKLTHFDCDNGFSVKNFDKSFKIYDNESFTYIDPENKLSISLKK